MGLDMSKVMGSVIDLFSINATVTIKRLTSSIDKYGDNTKTYSSAETISVAINDVTGEEDWNKYGLLVPGDKLFFIKASVTTPVVGDIITYRSSDYRIIKVNAPDMGEITHYECFAKKY